MSNRGGLVDVGRWLPIIREHCRASLIKRNLEALCGELSGEEQALAVETFELFTRRKIRGRESKLGGQTLAHNSSRRNNGGVGSSA